MEMMPYQPLREFASPEALLNEVMPPLPASLRESVRSPYTGAPVFGEPTAPAGLTAAWQTGLPVLRGLRLTLRELRLADAPSLLALLTTEEVARFISPPPTTLAEFEGFIGWAQRKRQAGTYACFAVVPAGSDTAVGIFQVRALSDDFATAEWGFALGSAHWGQGLFLEGAMHVLRFAFETVGVRRLEARACVENARGNGALRKVGAVREGVLRESFRKDGRSHDQNLWTILRRHWRSATTAISNAVH
jgi:[ribosomal protein S5]-alanine N-acetyltransferase